MVGAPATASNPLVIMAGLGASFVRSLTVQLVRAGPPARDACLEHDAIGALGPLLMATTPAPM